MTYESVLALAVNSSHNSHYVGCECCLLFVICCLYFLTNNQQQITIKADGMTLPHLKDGGASPRRFL